MLAYFRATIFIASALVVISFILISSALLRDRVLTLLPPIESALASLGRPFGQSAYSHCKYSDPYRRPGLLLRRSCNDSQPIDYADPLARWIPLDFENLTSPVEAEYPPLASSAEYDAFYIDNNETVDNAAQSRAPISWMARLVQYQALLKKTADASEYDEVEQELSDNMQWVHGRRILLLGDSVDRHNVFSFCTFLGLEPEETAGPELPAKHSTAYCHSPLLNFTIVQWHIPSMATHKPENWWFRPEMKIVAFEKRFADIFIPWSFENGILQHTSPDLVLFQSGLWDERAFAEATHYYETASQSQDGKRPYWKTPRKQVTYQHLHFLSVRLRKLVATVRQLFGDSIPLMYRAQIPRGQHTIRADDLGVISIDRMARVLAEQLDIEVFEWGKIVYGFDDEYMDDLHPKPANSLTWVFCDMVMSYLFRSVGGVEVEGKVVRGPTESRGWNECHSTFVEAYNR
ncbi:uncharacterized protein V2V93DRAFT_374489 [Kockiozyma suomiensis]|uniref:uncharacterized protein n=1 Tax=Kockiozyma suomiensis TaxID=1337062 RepID=UPI00334316B5